MGLFPCVDFKLCKARLTQEQKFALCKVFLDLVIIDYSLYSQNNLCFGPLKCLFSPIMSQFSLCSV